MYGIWKFDFGTLVFALHFNFGISNVEIRNKIRTYFKSLVSILVNKLRKEFTKSRVMRAIRASVVFVPTYLRANVPKRVIFSFLRANVTINVPKCQMRANVSTWRANVPNTC